LLVGTHVDDNASLVLHQPTYDAFMLTWKARYCDPDAVDVDPDPTQFYTGVRIRHSEGRIRHDCPRLMDALQLLVNTVPVDVVSKIPAAHTSCPLPKDALPELRMPASVDRPLVSSEAQAQAWSIPGSVGFIAGKNRPDVQLGFVAASQQIALNCTQYTQGIIIRIALYLLHTRHMALNFVRVPATTTANKRFLRLEAYSDSSALNAGSGQSWGGTAVAVPGSGLVAWKAHAPKKPTDSSGGAELIAATFVNKYVQGLRMLTKETSCREDKPWALHIDATATLSGVAMEKVSDNMRYLAARYAMLRYSQDVSNDIELTKIDTKDNVADGFTKPLQGADFARSRAQMLGPGHDDP
jgi:hypothetical protein